MLSRNHLFLIAKLKLYFHTDLSLYIFIFTKTLKSFPQIYQYGKILFLRIAPSNLTHVKGSVCLLIGWSVVCQLIFEKMNLSQNSTHFDVRQTFVR